jgi:hypothetical protein
MSRRLSSHLEFVSRIIGLAVAMVALAVQLGIGASVPQPELAQARTAALDAALILCHPALPDGTPRDTPFHHSTDCLICPLCQALDHSVIVLASRPELPSPAPVATGRRSNKIPPARAPPPLLRSAASPRGPPISI